MANITPKQALAAVMVMVIFAVGALILHPLQYAQQIENQQMPLITPTPTPTPTPVADVYIDFGDLSAEFWAGMIIGGIIGVIIGILICVVVAAILKSI